MSAAAAVHYTSEQEYLEAAELGTTQRGMLIPNAIEVPRRTSPTMIEGISVCGTRNWQIVRSSFFSRGLTRKRDSTFYYQAFAKVIKEHPGAVLVIAGNGEPAFVEALKKEANRMGVGQEITMDRIFIW